MKLRRNHTLGRNQGPHLILGPLLEKHKDEDDERQGTELTQLRVDIPSCTFQREGNLLDESTGHVDERTNESKLKGNLDKGFPFRFRFIKTRSNFVKPMRKQK